MERFTIKDIENLTGIKAHTFRIWEQRYNIFSPKRKESRHRFYDNDDLKKLLRIAFLYHNGWKASKISSLSEEQIINEVDQAAAASATESTFITRLLESAIEFDEHKFKMVLNDAVNALGFENCILQVCYPYLYKIGLLWSTNHVMPAQEHFSSYLIQHRIIAETEKIIVKNEKGTIVLMCHEEEFHELPLLHMNYLFRKHSWNTVNIGKNCTVQMLEQLKAATTFSHVYIHLLTNFTGTTVEKYFESLSASFTGLQFIVGGDGVKNYTVTLKNITVLKSEKEIRNYLETMI